MTGLTCDGCDVLGSFDPFHCSSTKVGFLEDLRRRMFWLIAARQPSGGREDRSIERN